MLWVGDAACGSGFGRATHHILEEMHKQGHEIQVIGINYTGEPHDEPYKIWPAYIPGGRDGIGVARLKQRVPIFQPDLIVIQTNPWNVPHYMRMLKEVNYTGPTIGIIAVEGKNCDGRDLNKLTHAIFWTRFGQQEALNGGMKSPSSCVIPLGVDTEKYCPGDRAEARQRLGLPGVPDGAFIVGNVNRNQNRKRVDLSVMYFAEWIKERDIRDAYLYLHLLPGSSTRVDVEQLAKYCGVQDRLILAEPEDIFHGASEEWVVDTYRAFDVQITTSLGEGWGLTTLEGMACGIPQMAGNYAAIAEWGEDGAYLIPCISEGVMPDVHNMIGGVPDKGFFIEALDMLYHNSEMRWSLGAHALATARQPQFNWKNIGLMYAEVLNTIFRESVVTA